MATRKPVKSGKSAGDPGVKTTMYLSLPLADRLDLAVASLRVAAGVQRGQVTASLIQAVALDLALLDWETGKETSALAVKVLERIRAKTS